MLRGRSLTRRGAALARKAAGAARRLGRRPQTSQEFWSDYNVTEHRRFRDRDESLRYFWWRCEQYFDYLDHMPVTGQDGYWFCRLGRLRRHASNRSERARAGLGSFAARFSRSARSRERS